MIDDDEIKATLANRKPYKQWVENLRVRLDGMNVRPEDLPRASVALLEQQQAFGYSKEQEGGV